MDGNNDSKADDAINSKMGHRDTDKANGNRSMMATKLIIAVMTMIPTDEADEVPLTWWGGILMA